MKNILTLSIIVLLVGFCLYVSTSAYINPGKYKPSVCAVRCGNRYCWGAQCINLDPNGPCEFVTSCDY